VREVGRARVGGGDVRVLRRVVPGGLGLVYRCQSFVGAAGCRDVVVER
jgi:hypothetical protein